MKNKNLGNLIKYKIYQELFGGQKHRVGASGLQRSKPMMFLMSKIRNERRQVLNS